MERKNKKELLQAAKLERKKELKEKLKPGAFIAHTWGYTVQRVSFFQVLEINKSKVSLGRPNWASESTGYDSDQRWVTGANPETKEVATATVRDGRISLDGDDSWKYLSFTEIGKKHSTWGD